VYFKGEPMSDDQKPQFDGGSIARFFISTLVGGFFGGNFRELTEMSENVFICIGE